MSMNAMHFVTVVVAAAAAAVVVLVIVVSSLQVRSASYGFSSGGCCRLKRLPSMRQSFKMNASTSRTLFVKLPKVSRRRYTQQNNVYKFHIVSI